MMQYGQVKIEFQAVDDSGYGDYIEKIVNIYADGSFTYVNVAQKVVKSSYDGGATWNLVEQSSKSNYLVYIGKTVDEVINLYKQHTLYDTVTWITPLAEV